MKDNFQDIKHKSLVQVWDENGAIGEKPTNAKGRESKQRSRF